MNEPINKLAGNTYQSIIKSLNNFQYLVNRTFRSATIYSEISYCVHVAFIKVCMDLKLSTQSSLGNISIIDRTHMLNIRLYVFIMCISKERFFRVHNATLYHRLKRTHM
jgi:hypothetical protein